MSFHINTDTGDVGECHAQKGQCPFGAANHYTSGPAARQAYEASMTEGVDSVQAQKINNARVKLTAAQDSLRKADYAMNDTANWEGASAYTTEGKKRQTAVERFKRAVEREAKAQAALDKAIKGKEPKEDLNTEIATAQKNLNEFYERVPYPSPTSLKLTELRTSLLLPKAKLHRKEFNIPDAWQTEDLSGKGVRMLPETHKVGPNGLLLRAVTRKPDYAPPGAPDDALYVETSAGIYISGPYKTPAELEAGVADYSGSTGPGIGGHD